MMGVVLVIIVLIVMYFYFEKKKQREMESDRQRSGLTPHDRGNELVDFFLTPVRWFNDNFPWPIALAFKFIYAAMFIGLAFHFLR
jgi:hypothetical protein